MTQLNIVFVDQATGEAEKVRAALRRMRTDFRSKAPLGSKGLQALERAASNVGREINSTMRALGISAGFMSGGIISVLTEVNASLTTFASESVRSHALAREVGITSDRFERLVIAAQAHGVSEKEARASVEKFARSVIDLRLGTESATRHRLEAGGDSTGSGERLARELQAGLQRSNVDETMLDVLRRMNDYSRSNRTWSAEVLGKSMGLHGQAWSHIVETFDKVKAVSIPSEAASKEFMLHMQKLRGEIGALQTRVGVALLPVFEELLKMMQSFFTEKNTRKIIDTIKRILGALRDLPWEDIRKAVDATLRWVGDESVKIMSDIANAVIALDEFVQMVDRWRGNNVWARGQNKPVLYPNIGRLDGGNDQPQFFGEDVAWPDPSQGGGGKIPGLDREWTPPNYMPEPETFTISPEYQKWQRENAESLQMPEGGVTVDDRRDEPYVDPLFDPKPLGGPLQRTPEPPPPQQRREPRGGGGRRQRFSGSEPHALRVERRIAKRRMVQTTQDMAIELQRFVDAMRDIREGRGGGSSDGGVSKKSRTRPMATGAGGRGGGTGTPTAETPRATAPVFFGDPGPGAHVVKGSVFGQFPEGSGSKIPGGWRDPDDVYKSGPKKGQTLGNYGGYSQETPGVALPYKGTAGRPGKMEGAPIRVWDLNKIGPGQRSVLARQVDIGPNQINPKSRDKGVDINAPLAESLGYSQVGKQAKETGRPVFPTGGKFKYDVISQGEMLRTRTEMDQERRHATGRALIWSRHGDAAREGNVEREDVDHALRGFGSDETEGQLKMDINVSGPRGVKVDAAVGRGDFAPAGDRGVSVNREITEDAE